MNTYQITYSLNDPSCPNRMLTREITAESVEYNDISCMFMFGDTALVPSHNVLQIKKENIPEKDIVRNK